MTRLSRRNGNTNNNDKGGAGDGGKIRDDENSNALTHLERQCNTASVNFPLNHMWSLNQQQMRSVMGLDSRADDHSPTLCCLASSS